MSFVIVLLLAGRTIFQCVTPGEPVLYTDLPCERGLAVDLSDVPIVQLQPLTEDDRQRLDALAANDKAADAKRANTLRQARTDALRNKAERRQRCDEARRSVSSIQEKRRHGYRPEEEERLDAAMQEARRIIRTDC